ncbi:MAG: anthranilate synthase component I [Cardiobacteriaceae bacterium]|nr:anthranilate synthase component I [Cardiobacteriaceae bacterium]
MSCFTHKAVVRTLLSDLLTPVALYDRLASLPYAYLLESVEGGERWARYSIIGLPARERIELHHGEIKRFVQGECVETLRPHDPLAWIADFQASIRPAPLSLDVPFTGGLVGYFAYDCIGYIEPRLQKRPDNDPLGVPDALFMLSFDVAVMDNLRGELHLICHLGIDEDEAIAHARLDAIEAQLLRSGVAKPTKALCRHAPLPEVSHHFAEDEFLKAVDKIKDYIVAGDCMQVVLAQGMQSAFAHSALDFYRALRVTNPSPYMYLLDLGNFQVVGSSPEILARVQDGVVTVRPIAGTRKRGQTREQDLALEKDLLADEKEVAEHAMLIDLGRNDIGRVCEVGTVRVTEQMVVERYSHVMHMVSNVEGRLRDGVNAMDVFKATFPAGTLSGAPKIRAMEIIDELEPTKRGIYGGAVGYWAFGGNMDLAIAIRTAVLKDGILHAQAGAGVVYDSVPASEWQETLNKAKALFSAASLLREDKP